MELMASIYKDAEMGVYTTNNLLKQISKTENKINHVLEKEVEEYEKFKNISEEILNKNDITPKTSSLFTKISSNMGIKMETIKDNSDAALASMLIEGFTMGSLSVKKKIKRYSSIASKKYLKIARNFAEYQEKEIEKLKTFL